METTEHPQLTQAREFVEKLRQLARTSPGKVALSVQAEGEPPVELLANQTMRIRSISKIAIGIAYAREVAKDPAFAGKTVTLDELAKSDPGYYDGGNHNNWKDTLPKGATEASYADVARGMLQQSSNVNTQFLLSAIGHEKVNAVMAELGVGWQPFAQSYDELNAPLRGSVSDTIKIMDAIAKEPPAVQAAYKAAARPFKVISVSNGEANGYTKNGTGLMPMPDGNALHDFNHALVGEHNGKKVSVALFTNNLDTPTQEFLGQRLGAFMCEATCNEGFRAASSVLLNAPAVSASHGTALLKKPIAPTP